MVKPLELDHEDFVYLSRFKEDFILQDEYIGEEMAMIN